MGGGATESNGSDKDWVDLGGGRGEKTLPREKTESINLRSRLQFPTFCLAPTYVTRRPVTTPSNCMLALNRWIECCELVSASGIINYQLNLFPLERWFANRFIIFLLRFLLNWPWFLSFFFSPRICYALSLDESLLSHEFLSFFARSPFEMIFNEFRDWFEANGRNRVRDGWYPKRCLYNDQFHIAPQSGRESPEQRSDYTAFRILYVWRRIIRNRVYFIPLEIEGY